MDPENGTVNPGKEMVARKKATGVDVDDHEDPAEMQRLAEQFRGLVKAAGGPTRIATILKKSPNTVNSWTTGKTKIPFSVVLRVAQQADVSLDAFAAGEDATAASRSLAPFTAAGTSVPDGFVSVPVMDVRASAGTGALSGPFDPEGTDLVAFREAWLRSLGLIPGRVHILWAMGDSMLPTIRDGDMMLVDRTIDRIVNDGIYVVVAVGAVRVKRVSLRQNGSVVLRSDNERYEAETIPADEVSQLIVEGRVRWVGGPI